MVCHRGKVVGLPSQKWYVTRGKVVCIALSEVVCHRGKVIGLPGLELVCHCGKVVGLPSQKWYVTVVES